MNPRQEPRCRGLGGESGAGLVEEHSRTHLPGRWQPGQAILAREAGEKAVVPGSAKPRARPQGLKVLGIRSPGKDSSPPPEGAEVQPPTSKPHLRDADSPFHTGSRAMPAFCLLK